MPPPSITTVAPSPGERIDEARRPSKSDRERFNQLIKIAERATNAGVNDPFLTNLLSINIDRDPIDARSMMDVVEEHLNRLGVDILKRMMEPFEEPRAYQIIQSGTTHRRIMVGRTINHPEFGEIKITPELFKFIELNFSIGTPPITKQNLRRLQEAILGDPNPNEIRELAKIINQTDGVDFEDFAELANRLGKMIAGSAHYTTPEEAQSHLNRSKRFNGIEGGSALKATTVSGGADRAEELLRRYIFHGADKTGHIETLKVDEPKDALEKIRQSPDKTFILRVKRIPVNTWEKDAWNDCLARVIIINDDKIAQRTNNTYVYSLMDDVIDSIDRTHTNLAGKNSSPQMHLREILEDFSPEKISKMHEAMAQELKRLEQAIARISYENGDQEELGTLVKDWFTAKQFKKTLKAIEKISTLDLEKGPDGISDFDRYAEKKRQTVGEKWMRYFYKRLQQTGRYQAHVGNGGGREGLELVSRFRTREVRNAVDDFKSQEGNIKAAIEKWVETLGYRHRATALNARGAGWDAESQIASRQRAHRGLAARAQSAVGSFVDKTRDVLAEKALEKLGINIADVSKEPSRVTAVLTQLDAVINKTLANPDEDSDPRSPIGQALAVLGDKGGKAKIQILHKLYELVARYGAIRVPHPEAAQAVLDEIHRTEGRLDGRLIMERVMWTYGDVMDERFFPPDQKIIIDLEENRQPNIGKMRQKLFEMKMVFREVPALFELLCKSMSIVINSPKNPDGTVYSEATAMGILSIASEFGITIIDDNSYYKVIGKDEAGRRIRILPFAEIYEEHRHLFPQPVRVITVATTTKNLSGAGERLHNIITDDPALGAFIAEKRQGTNPHLMALHLTEQKLDAGNGIKEAYKHLQAIDNTLRFDKDPTALYRCIEKFNETLYPKKLLEWGLSHSQYKAITDAYYLLCRLTGRGGTGEHAKKVITDLLKALKSMRPEKTLAEDIDKRMIVAKKAIESSKNACGETPKYIKPDGAFYVCVEMDDYGKDTKPLHEFLMILNEHKGVGMVQRDDTNSVRISLGDELEGDAKSYERLGLRIQIALEIVFKYWKIYQEDCTDIESFEYKMSEESRLAHRILDDKHALYMQYSTRKLTKEELLSEGKLKSLEKIAREHKISFNGLIQLNKEVSENFHVTEKDGKHYCEENDDIYIKGPDSPLVVHRSESGMVFQIEPTSNAANIILEGGLCENSMEFASSKSFQIIFRFLLRNFYREIPVICDLTEEDVLARFHPSDIARLLNDEPLDPGQREIMRQILFMMHQKYFGSRIRTHLLQVINDESSMTSRQQQLMGASEIIGQYITTLLLRFDHTWGKESDGYISHGVARGYQVYENIEPNENLPNALKNLIPNTPFVGTTATTNPHPSYNTEINRRLGGRAYSFLKRGDTPEEEENIKSKLYGYIPHLIASGEYVCKAVQVGHSKQLLVMHKSSLHFLHDQCRLFPELENVSSKEALNKANFDSFMFFGIPKKLLGEHQITGYVMDECANGESLRVGWVAGANLTDYFGFVKKWLLTLHNDRTIEKGAVPVHGLLAVLDYEDGDCKGIIASGDSATGKSELMAKLQEMIQRGELKGVERIRIYAGDMMSLHIGKDGQIYAIGTETGDFTRLDDLEGTSWARENAHRLHRASQTNPGQDNRRATIPDICEVKGVLTPTQIHYLFCFNNYEDPGAGKAIREKGVRQSYELIAAGRRKNKKTSEDLPDFNTDIDLTEWRGLAGRMDFNKVLQWNKKEGSDTFFIGYRDGQCNWRDALRCIESIFVGREEIIGVEYDPIENSYYLRTNETRELLTFEVYTRLYEPVVSTFYSNVFGPTSNKRGMIKNVERLVNIAEQAGVVGGEVCTQLARDGMSQAGPERAAEELAQLLMEPRFRTQFNATIESMKNNLRKKMVDESLQPATEATTNNIRQKRTQDALRVTLENDVTTPFFNNMGAANETPYNPDIVPPTIRNAIESILQIKPDRSINFHSLQLPKGMPQADKLDLYDQNELIYLIMVKTDKGILDSNAENIRRNQDFVYKAAYLANKLRPTSAAA